MVELSGAADRVELIVWSVPLRRLVKVDLDSLGPGWEALPLPADFLHNIGPGLYYVTVQAWRGPAVTPRVISRFYVLP